MDIGIPLRQLGNVEISELKQLILSQPDEAWHEQRHRQKAYDVHSDTESIVLLFCDESWPNGEIHKEPGWDRLAKLAEPIMANILNTHYPQGGIIIRAMAAKLKAQGQIKPHRDTLHSFHIGHRIHVPITTNPGVRFMIEGKPYQFQPGHAYELNNQLRHSVINMSNEDRISFIFDYVPPSKLNNQQESLS